MSVVPSNFAASRKILFRRDEARTEGWIPDATKKTAKLKKDAAEFYDIAEPRLMSWLLLTPRAD